MIESANVQQLSYRNCENTFKKKKSWRCFIIMGGRILCSNPYKLISSWKRLFPPYEVNRGHNSQTADIKRVSGGKHINKVSKVGGELLEQPFNGLRGHAERQPSVTSCQTSSDLKRETKPGHFETRDFSGWLHHTNNKISASNWMF